MSLGSPLGILACANCKNQYIRVEMVNLGRSPGIDHVDFFCAVCGQFVNHLDVSPYTPDPKMERLLDEIDKELEPSSQSGLLISGTALQTATHK